MKNADIIVNGCYWTRVGMAKVLVRVVERHNGGRTYGSNPRARPDVFVVERVDTGKFLRTSRNAAALHMTRTFDAVDPGTGPRALDVTGKTVIPV